MLLTLSFEEIHEYYLMKLWFEPDVKLAVTRGKITKEQYKIIIGADYIE